MDAAEPADIAAPKPLHPRLVFFACAFGMLAYAMAQAILAAALQSLSVEFDRNLAECGVMLIYAPVGFVFCTLLSGWLSDRWGQRVFILFGFGLLAMGMALIGLTRNFAVLALGLVLIGACGGLVESPLSAVQAIAFPKRRAKALNMLQIFFNVGAVAGPALMAVVLWRGMGWRSAFGIMIAVAAVAFGLSIVGLPTLSHHRVSRQAEADGERPTRWGVVSVMAFVIFLYVGGELTVASWSAKYLHELYGTPVSRAALVVSGFWFGMMLGRALYVLIVERMGTLWPLLASAALGCGLTVCVALARSPVIAAAGCVAVGFCLGGTWATILSYTAHRSPGRTGTVFGILVASGAMGWLVIPPMGGWLAEHSRYGLRATMMLGALVIFIEGLVLIGVFFFERSARRSEARA